ncbi:hypothetical protein P692DRAFT_20393125 [Suillus brevipes Sb2]|nr:hypothetical protein P692DRAFT_20393125 [Suillus brevipes Sb2]
MCYWQWIASSPSHLHRAAVSRTARTEFAISNSMCSFTPVDFLYLKHLLRCKSHGLVSILHVRNLFAETRGSIRFKGLIVAYGRNLILDVGICLVIMPVDLIRVLSLPPNLHHHGALASATLCAFPSSWFQCPFAHAISYSFASETDCSLSDRYSDSFKHNYHRLRPCELRQCFHRHNQWRTCLSRFAYTAHL